jgi:hypothetical protein
MRADYVIVYDEEDEIKILKFLEEKFPDAKWGGERKPMDFIPSKEYGKDIFPYYLYVRDIFFLGYQRTKPSELWRVMNVDNYIRIESKRKPVIRINGIVV